MISKYALTSLESKRGNSDKPISYFCYNQIDIKDLYLENSFLFRNWNDLCEIIYVKKGCITIECDCHNAILKEYDLAFINPNEIHQITQIQPGTHFYILQFDPRLFESEYKDAFDQQIIKPYLNGRIGFPLYVHDDRLGFDLIESIIKNIIKIYSRPTPFAYYEAKLGLYSVFLTFFELNLFVEKDLEISEEDKKTINQYKKAIEYLEKHYQEEIHLNEWAEFIPCTQAHLNKLFNDFLHDSPIHYLIEYRIEKACQLLKTSTLSVAEISRLSGFSNVSYFIRQFKEFKGMTPLKYRKSFH